MRLRLSPHSRRALVSGLIIGIPFGQFLTFVVMRANSVSHSLTALLVSLFLAVGITAYFEYMAPAYRRLPFLLNVAASGLTLGAIVGVSITGSVWLMRAASQRVSPIDPRFLASFNPWKSSDFLYSILWTLIGIVGATFFVELSRKLGPGVLRNWLLGRYRHPRVEDRIFMFLDLRDSTTLAEELGHLKFSALIRDFFNDMTEPLIRHRGNVSHYIGDEAVLTWPLSPKAAKNSVAFFYAFRDEIQKRQDHYLAQYGIQPRFKAGLHCGPAVVTEVGRLKSEIVYHGDVLNTTARITGLAGEIGDGLLLSEALVEVLPAGHWQVQPAGEHHLKGKASKTKVFSLGTVGEPSPKPRSSLSSVSQ